MSGTKQKRIHIKDAVVRLATEKDTQAILHVCDVYDDLDSLPSMVPHNLNNPNMLCHVAEIRGQIVGYGEWEAVDAGTTLIGVNGCVSSKYRGTSVSRQLQAHGRQAALNKWPNALRLRAASTDNDYWQNKVKASGTGYRIIHRRVEAKVAWDVDLPKLCAVVQQWNEISRRFNYRHPVRKVDRTELLRVLRNKGDHQTLFPKTFLSVDWIPYELMEQNFQLVADYCTQAFISTDGDGGVRALSLCRPHQCRRGLLYLVDYHGELEADTYCDHVMRLSEAALGEHRRGKIFISAHVEERMDMTQVKRILSDLGSQDGGDFLDYVLYLALPMIKPIPSKL